MRISYRKEKARWLWRVSDINGCFSTNRAGEGIYLSRGSQITELIPPEQFTVAFFLDMSAKNKIRRVMNERALPSIKNNRKEESV